MRLVLLFCCLLPLFSNGQSGKNKPKVSSARGTLFGYWGYNRSWYTKSAINFVGPGYDFTLKGSHATDNPAPFSLKTYFNPKSITVPQFSTRIGYYIRNHYAISVGYDHLKYVFADRNEVLLSGTINPGIDTVTDWSGTYTNEPIVTDQNKFHYENSNGLNYLRVEFTRTDQIYKAGKNDLFAISTNVGVGLGGLLSFNDFLFAGKKDMETVSMSGFAFSAHAGLRLEFFRHFFFQSNFSGGYMHQAHVRTRLNEPNAYAKQKFGYTALDAGVGFFLYIRPTNDCNSCPNW